MNGLWACVCADPLSFEQMWYSREGRSRRTQSSLSAAAARKAGEGVESSAAIRPLPARTQVTIHDGSKLEGRHRHMPDALPGSSYGEELGQVCRLCQSLAGQIDSSR